MVKDLNYKVGDKGASGETISFIIGHSPTAIVYQDSRDHVQWETNEDILTSSQVKANREYDILNFKIKSFVPIQRHTMFEMQLAQALFQGLSENVELEVPKHFAAASKAISQEIYSNSAFYYVLFAGILTVLASIGFALAITLVLTGGHKIIGLGSLAGSIGAFASILFRGNKLKLREYESPRALAFQGITRILLGIVFGAFSACAVNANIVFGFLASDQWSIVVVGFIAGFSEKYVPELIKSVE